MILIQLTNVYLELLALKLQMGKFYQFYSPLVQIRPFDRLKDTRVNVRPVLRVMVKQVAQDGFTTNFFLIFENLQIKTG